MTIEDKCRWLGFIVLPNDTVDLIEPGDDGDDSDDDVDTDSFLTAPGLFAALEAAGYPLSREPNGIPSRQRFFDLAVDPTDPTAVVAYTTGPKPREHMLPEDQAAVFLDWYRANVAEEAR
jgi:hypothetical protein